MTRTTVILTILALAAIAPGAFAQAAPPLRGEAARLERYAYDYLFRNSNRNVVRASKHLHPTRNVFRSSRHYAQRVAASADGYPLQTFQVWTRGLGDDARQVVRSYVHHRRHPYGRGDVPGAFAVVATDNPEIVVVPVATPPSPHRALRAPSRAERGGARLVPVLESRTTSEGALRITIRSVPVDDADGRLARHDADDAPPAATDDG